MQPEKSDQPGFPVEDYLLFLARTWAFSIEVFLHRRFGLRYIGAQGAAVILLVPIYAAFWEPYNVLPMLLFLPLYLLMCLVARASVIARRLRGELEHSYYNGRSHLMWILPRWDEKKVKGWIEPLLLLVVGGAVCRVYPPFGVYLIIAALCMGAMTCSEIVYEHDHDLDMNDLVIEQEQRGERFRAKRGDR